MIAFSSLRNKNGVVSLPGEHDYLAMLSADEIAQAEDDAEKIEWKDIVTLYDDDELDYSELETEPDEGLHPDETLDTHDNQVEVHHDEEQLAAQPEEVHSPAERLCPHCSAPVSLTERRPNGNSECEKGHHFPTADIKQSVNENLSAGQRSKRRLIFARSKSRRRMAMKIALHRQSSPMKLQSRSKAMAKRILVKKMLRGRKRSQLSPQEKDRLEKMLKTSSPVIMRIAQRVMPRIKAIEQTRLKHGVKKRKVYEGLPPEAFNNVEGPVSIPTPEEIRIMNTEPSVLKKARTLVAGKK